MEGIRERYDALAEEGFHRGAFQSIESVWLSDDGKSALGQVCLPESWEHEHDGFYHAHPAMLDGAIQMADFLMSTTEAEESWVPAGISSVMMHKTGKLHGQRKIWARVWLENDSPKMKLCNIDLLDEDEGLIMSAEGFRYARLLGSAMMTSDNKNEPRMYTTRWIETDSLSQDDTDQDQGSPAADVCIMTLPGCLALDMSSVEEEDKMNVSTMLLSDLECLADANDVAEVVLVPLVDIESTDASSTVVLEACVSLMQIMSKKLQDATDGVRRRICFWTRNAEGPAQVHNDDASESGKTRSEDYDETCSLVGGSVWGMVRSAAMEMDSRVLSMVCIDTDCVVGAKEAWRQVWQELVVSHWNARSASASGDDDGSNTVAEVEVCYRGKSRYVRRLCEGRSHIMGDTELVLFIFPCLNT